MHRYTIWRTQRQALQIMKSESEDEKVPLQNVVVQPVILSSREAREASWEKFQYKKTFLTCVTLLIVVGTGGWVFAVTSLVTQAHHGTQAGSCSGESTFSVAT